MTSPTILQEQGACPNKCRVAAGGSQAGSDVDLPADHGGTGQALTGGEGCAAIRAVAIAATPAEAHTGAFRAAPAETGGLVAVTSGAGREQSSTESRAGGITMNEILGDVPCPE